jgi:methyl-accepting chemotaxis protein
MVEQSTAASHALSQDAQEMARLVSRFDVGARPTAVRSYATSSGAPRPAPATRQSAPSPSPVHAMGHKLAASFGGATPESAAGDWEEF